MEIKFEFLHTVRFWRGLSFVLLLFIMCAVGLYFYHLSQDSERFEVVSDLSGNIFPSLILSTASTGTQVVLPQAQNCLGNPQATFGIKIKSSSKLCKVHIELSENNFFEHSVSDFVLPMKDLEYVIYPDVLWKYDELKNNAQAQPVSFSISVKIGREKPIQKIVTYSVRSINECLLCYKDENMHFHDTSICFAAYVNEEHPMIDQLLREALDTKIVRKFVGTQHGEKQVEKQVYALWFMLQKRKFSYSSVSYSSLSSNIVTCQRVRTIDDALQSSQINCVDGTVLFASLLRAINIEPVMVRVPGHMFVGYYTDAQKKNVQFLETTMIGDVNLDDYFPEEKLDSVAESKGQSDVSKLTFDKAKEYAQKKYNQYRADFEEGNGNVQFLVISKSIRSMIQSIGR